MATLKEVHAQLHRAFRGEAEVGEVAGALGVDPKRLAIYQRFVRGHIDDVLASTYPIVRAACGEDAWSSWCDRYFAAHPARHWELNQAAAAFPVFLACELEAGRPGVLPVHVDLAELEWAQLAAYLHPAEMPDPLTLDAPVLNPSLQILSLSHPLVPLAELWDDGELDTDAPLPEPLETPEVVLVYRHPERQTVVYQRANDDLLFAVKVVHEGLDPEDAAREAGLPPQLGARAVSLAAASGLVIVPAT